MGFFLFCFYDKVLWVSCIFRIVYFILLNWFGWHWFKNHIIFNCTILQFIIYIFHWVLTTWSQNLLQIFDPLYPCLYAPDLVTTILPSVSISLCFFPCFSELIFILQMLKYLIPNLVNCYWFPNRWLPSEHIHDHVRNKIHPHPLQIIPLTDFQM